MIINDEEDFASVILNWALKEALERDEHMRERYKFLLLDAMDSDYFRQKRAEIKDVFGFEISDEEFIKTWIFK